MTVMFPLIYAPFSCVVYLIFFYICHLWHNKDWLIEYATHTHTLSRGTILLLTLPTEIRLVTIQSQELVCCTITPILEGLSGRLYKSYLTNTKLRYPQVIIVKIVLPVRHKLTVTLLGNKSEVSPTVYQSKFNELLSQYDGYTRIITDGSKSWEAVGSAAIVVSRLCKKRLPNNSSNLSA